MQSFILHFPEKDIDKLFFLIYNRVKFISTQNGGVSIMKFGEKLRAEREKRSMTQAELAEKIGVTRATIVNYERCSSHPKDRQIYFKLADIFSVNVNHFLADDEAFIAEAMERYGRKGALEMEDILEGAAALFAGGELSEADKLGFLHDLQAIYFEATDRAKKKYTPKKYRKPKSSGN